MELQPSCLGTISTEGFYQQQNFLIALPLNKTNSSAKPINRSAMLTEVVAIEQERRMIRTTTERGVIIRTLFIQNLLVPK
jgi:hypothetical protein